MNQKLLQIAFCFTIVAAQKVCLANTLTTNTTTTSIQQFPAYSNLAGAYYGGEAISPIYGSFAGSDEFEFRISAPTGYRYSAIVDPAETLFRLAIGVAWYAPNGGSGLATPMPSNVTLTDYVGSPYSGSIEVRTYNDGKSIYAEGWLVWSSLYQPIGSFSFSSIVVDADLSSYSGAALPYTKFETSYSAGVGFLSSLSNRNSVALTASVPERPTYEIMATGLLALCLIYQIRPNPRIARSEA